MNKEKLNKIIKITAVILVVFIILFLIWNFLIYPRIIFHNNEKKLEELGKRYYEVNYMYLPKEENRVISVSLNTLIKQDYTDGLYIKKDLCDINNSNVKAVNKAGEYNYYVYLKCGNYESKVDHTGPIITLNGKKEITLSKGDTYTEEGVKEVVDEIDGKLDVKNVTIKGSVDTTKIGTYEITYTAKDSLGNKTTEKRIVKVEETLASIIKNDTNNTNYYKGNVDNNYVMFNNMLFRLVKLNADNTVTIVSDDPLANVDYTSTDKRLKNSSIDKWLNDYFYNLLDEDYQKLITSSTWCDDIVSESNKSTITECTRQTEKMKIGLLSIQDYNKSLVGYESYLNLRNLIWFPNFTEDNKNYGMTNAVAYPNGLLSMESEYLFNIRPALNLKENTSIIDGSGTENDPYIIVKQTKTKRNSDLNKRQIGEYVTYSGYLFRISNILDDGKIEVIMNSVLQSDSNEIQISYDGSIENKIYNPEEKGNIAYIIKNEMTRYIDTKSFAKTKIEVPIYNDKILYSGKKDIKEYNLKITIPSTFDIFSAKGKKTSNGGYWLIDSSEKENMKVIRAQGTTTYIETDDYASQGVKIKAYFANDTIIKDGDGTRDNPYKISN